MKPFMPYIGIYVGTFIVSVLVVFLLYKAKPELFAGASKADPKTEHAAQTDDSGVAPDTTEAETTSVSDSAAVPTRKKNEVAVLQDSIKSLVSLLTQETEKAKKPLPQPTVKEPENASDPKAMAKILDGIKSEQAVKILNNLSDKEVRELFPLLNKRQASKILSALDPSRAAKLIR